MRLSFWPSILRGASSFPVSQGSRDRGYVSRNPIGGKDGGELFLIHLHPESSAHRVPLSLVRVPSLVPCLPGGPCAWSLVSCQAVKTQAQGAWVCKCPQGDSCSISGFLSGSHLPFTFCLRAVYFLPSFSMHFRRCSSMWPAFLALFNGEHWSRYLPCYFASNEY